MNNGRKKRSAGRSELALSLVLRWGVISSAAVIVLGVLLMIFTGNSGYGAGLDMGRLLFYDESNLPHRFYPTDLQTILSGLLSLKPFAVIDLGLVMLVGTPVMRVGISILLFGLEGDRKYVAITTLVFLILIIGVVAS
ncbi:MAG: DUF1634 domain-containing protein [Thaumarchaeota archaeon]|nr:DUF1634 domain-containing protein [Nitrososphaerota archaeon]